MFCELLSILSWWTYTGMPDEQREGLQEELIDIILQVLKRNPQLHYYQGYHDIVVTFLLVVKERLATALVEKLSTHHLRYLYIICLKTFPLYYAICLHLWFVLAALLPIKTCILLENSNFIFY